MDSRAEHKAEEGRPQGLHEDLPALQDVGDGDEGDKRGVSGSMFWGLRGTPHVPRQEFRPLGADTSTYLFKC